VVRRGYVGCRGDLIPYYYGRLHAKYADEFSPESVNAFFRDRVAGILVSVESPDNRETFRNRAEQAVRAVAESPFTKGIPVYRDWGGYQIQTGGVPPENVDWLVKEHLVMCGTCADLVDKTFSPDIVPSKRCRLGDWHDVYGRNKEALDLTARLPDEERRKVLLVHHFRGPHTHSMFKTLLFGDGYVDAFEGYATGGIASGRVSRGMPVVAHAVPLVDLVDWSKRSGRDALQFHVLGSAEFHNYLTNALISRLVAKVHGIEVAFTCDTNRYIVELAKAQASCAVDEARENIIAVEYRRLFAPGFSRPTGPERLLYDCANKAFRPSALLTTKEVPLYNDQGRTDAYWGLPMASYYEAHKWAYDWSEGWAGELLDIYLEGRNVAFSEALAQRVAHLLPNRSDTGIVPLVRTIVATLDLLRTLNPEESARLVQAYLKEADPPGI